MPGTIDIRNLRNIKKLKFEIPDRGVWLLTAGNGAGKTSLLACIRRIGHPNAFPVHFPSSLRSSRLDDHSNGAVTYEINDDTVEYAYRGERWTPRPRSNSHLFEKFGYAAVMYIGATAERITPRPEDFEITNVRSASAELINGANAIFETNKFSNLKTINLKTGRGNDAFVLALDTSPKTYHSEKHFSLGELCVLKLLRLIKDASNNSMIIVDELEMALHPRAQINLLRYLQEQSKKKSLTVIFSTHSVTLLKAIDRRYIIYLERQDDGEICPVIGCFPTYAIGNIAANEETLPDVIIYVEDLYARDMLGAFFDKFANEKIPEPTARPSIKIVPVGPFSAVISFLEKNRSALPDHVRQKAILDQDVSEETIESWKAKNNHSQLQKFSQLDKQIGFLPFTPEVGLMDHISANARQFELELRSRFSDNQIRINTFCAAYDTTLSGSLRRNNAKDRCDEMISYLEQRTQKNKDTLREQICEIFAIQTWQQYRAEFMRLLSPLVTR